jgi:hypothetical protein
MTHGSSLLDPCLTPVTVEGDTPEEIAEAVALYVERGGDDAETPGVMNMRAVDLRMAGKLGKPEQWTTEFRNRTGTNVNCAVNAIGKVAGSNGRRCTVMNPPTVSSPLTPRVGANFVASMDDK